MEDTIPALKENMMRSGNSVDSLHLRIWWRIQGAEVRCLSVDGYLGEGKICRAVGFEIAIESELLKISISVKLSLRSTKQHAFHRNTSEPNASQSNGTRCPSPSRDSSKTKWLGIMQTFSTITVTPGKVSISPTLSAFQ
jgi:hypothetical protein